MKEKKSAMASHILWNGITQIVTMVTSLLLVRVLLEKLGPVSYGIWVLVGSMIAYYQLMEFGIGSALIRSIAAAWAVNDRYRVRSFFSTAIFFFSGGAILLEIVSIFLSFLPPHLFGVLPEMAHEFKVTILLCGSAVALSFASSPFNATLMALERFDITGVIAILINGLRLIIVIFWLDQSLITLSWINFGVMVGGTIVMAVSVIIILQELPLRLSAVSMNTVKTVFGFGLFTFLICLADLVRFRMQTIIISASMGVTLVTLFYLGNRLVELGRQAAGMISGPFVPRFSAMQNTEEKEKTNRMFLTASRLSAFLMAIFIGFLVGSGEQIIKLWVGDTISDVKPSFYILVILAIPVLCDITQTISVSYFYATAHHNRLAAITGAEAVLTLILCIILAKPFGIYGVALGSAIPMIFCKGLIQPVLIGNLTGIPKRVLFNSSVIMPVTLALVLAVFQLMIYQLVPTENVFINASMVFVTLAIFVPIAFVLFFSKKERLWMLQYIKEWLTDAKETAPDIPSPNQENNYYKI